MRPFYILDTDVYDFLYLLHKYSVAGFNLFLHKFQEFYHKDSMLYDVYMLGAHGGFVCGYDCSTYISGKLGPTSGSGFM